jgi:transcriptional regulator with XRE-family HTH domain
MGLAVRAAREAAKLTLSDLATQTGVSLSSLSRTENGLRALEFTEALAIAAACQVDIEGLRTLGETFERQGATQKQSAKQALVDDLNELQQLAIKTAIALRTGAG